MKAPTLKIFTLAVLGAACALPASAAVSDTVGYNTIPCLANSDTIVGVPLRQSGSIKGALNGTPTFDVPSDTATLTLSAAPSGTVDALAFSHYLQFTSGTKNGQYFTIGANSGTSVTIDLNGGNLTGVVSSGASADTFIIAKYWTLNDLFPPAGATTAWDGSNVPNGHAIVASTNTSLLFRKTQVLLPDVSSVGYNLPASKIFYITGSAWVSTDGTPNPGSFLIFPDGQLIIRHPASVTKATNYTCIGEVSMNAISIPLKTSSSGPQDVRISVPRPVDVKLSELNLIGSGGFIASPNTSLLFRKDQLYVYDNAVALTNKPASTIYYYNSGTSQWMNVSGNTPADNDIIPAGSGFMIRKAKSDGNPDEWVNTAAY